MIPTEIEARRKVIAYMLEGCVTNSEQLTEWEFNFITGCSDQFEKNQNLSDRQCEILERIYNKQI